jgi:alpha-tubulin suppressor-like RCC1 family protein
MRARAGTAGRAVLRRAAAVTISLAAALGGLMTPQAALAAAPGASSISAGYLHACALENGKAYCWGFNDSGDLGDGSTTSSSVPVAVDTSGALAGKTLTQISAGGEQTCALDSTGAAYCWGFNFSGELGDGSTASSSVPVAVDTSGALAGKTLTQISAGDEFACAVDSAGAGYCWGFGGDGELGDNQGDSSSVPVAVDTSGALAGNTLTQISAGGGFACAVDSAGAAYCWGFNDDGELGGGAGGGFGSTPVPVDTSGALAGKTLTQISTGANQTCALDSAGAAYCWGYNRDGELGDGSTIGSSTPVAVDTSGALAGKTLTDVRTGIDQSCAVDSDGVAYCWGGDGYGELGDASTTDSDIPVAVDTSGVLTGKTLTHVSTGGFVTCALDGAGAVYCWGDDNSGDLGDGSTAMSDVPVLTRLPGGLAFTSRPAVTAAYGVPLAFTITAAGTPPPRITHTGALPAGLRFAEENGGRAAITGTPGRTAAGIYRLVLTARNTTGTATQPFALTITRAPALATTAAAAGTTGKAFRLAINVTGYPLPALAETGPLPRGLTFASKTITSTSQDAVIAGTPAAGTAGTYPVTITATSSSGRATAHLTLTISP